MNGIAFQQIDDIHCHVLSLTHVSFKNLVVFTTFINLFFTLFQWQDQNNNDVLDKNQKPCIHSDGTGYISEDLARMCPTDIYKGKRVRSENMQVFVLLP